jgi:hypothetical protein
MSESNEWRPGKGLSIDALYAWVVTEPDGGEGLAAINLPQLGWTPLIGADVDRMKSLRPYAEGLHRTSGQPMRLVRYSQREDLEILP